MAVRPAACFPAYRVRGAAYPAARRKNQDCVAPGTPFHHASPPSLILPLASLPLVFRRLAIRLLPAQSFHETKGQPLYLPRYTAVVVPLGVWLPENERAGVSSARLPDVATPVLLCRLEPCHPPAPVEPLLSSGPLRVKTYPAP